ncbi:hypothetical protein [Aliagarivorans marinus]|uniref:hypothetical protein n=1 Tax=Aliagarivorans marinus TaxID=561965 RepID=UPI0004267B17|nr:hypothetical protein [Aliagarivorans marinus]
MDKKPLYGLLSAVLMLICATGQAAIVNNNHLYQLSEVILLQLDSLQAPAAGDADDLLVSDKLATNLVFKSQQLLRLSQTLAQQQGKSAAADIEIPMRAFRPRDVQPYLQALSDQLVALGGTLPDEQPTRPLGKNSNDIYKQLLLIEPRLRELLNQDIALQQAAASVSQVRNSLLDVAQAKSLSLKLGNPPAAPSDVNLTETHLLAFQCFHLMERLLRELGIEPTDPGHFPVGDSSSAQLADTLVNMQSELHRAKTMLQLESAAAPSEQESSSLSSLYSTLEQLRDALYMMLHGGSLS